MSKQKSPIDELFYELYGYYPPKAGQAYEMIVSAVFKLVFDKEVKYNQNLRGDFSDTIYQLDGLIIEESNNEMVEVKDYTIDKRKVGRGDVQKLQGALSDLPIDGGAFASATGFTKPAIKYANSSEINPINKDIKLFDIKPSTVEDENGRIKKIIFNIHMIIPEYEKGRYKPIFTKNGLEKIKSNNLIGKEIGMKLDNFYDENNNIIITLYELTRFHPPTSKNEKGFVASGSWIINGFFEIENSFYEIYGVEYEVPYSITKSDLVVEGGGNPKILFKSYDGIIDKLITDKELKQVEFTEGKVIVKK